MMNCKDLTVVMSGYTLTFSEIQNARSDEETEESSEVEEVSETEEISGTQTQASASQTASEDGLPFSAGIFIGGGAGLIIGAAIAALILTLLFKKRLENAKRSALRRQPYNESAGVPYMANTGELNRPANIYVGKVHAQGARENQQDSFAVSPAQMLKTHGILAVVCDGMGGLSGGERVSQSAVSAMMEGFGSATGTPDQILLELVLKANRAVNRLLGPSGYSKSGSTMVAGLIKDSNFYYISIGDSRIALLRDNVLYQLNRDHIYCNDLALEAINGKGTLQKAFTHPKAKGLTSFLGMGTLKYVDIPACPVAIKPGDRFVLMSDGVYNALTEEELKGALSLRANESAEYLRKLIQGKNYKTQDNYTAVIFTVEA